MELVIFAAVVLGSAVCGYAFRGWIGKEVKEIGVEIRAEFAKAVVEAKKLEAEAKAKL